MSNKSSLRTQARKRRQAIADDLRASKHQAINRQLIDSLDWSKIFHIHIYQSNPKWHEVDTTMIIDYVMSEQPHIKLTLAPQDSSTISYEQTYGVIIVPVLAYDENNYRLGMGQGWYDRFLATQPMAHKVGLAYKESSVPSAFPEPHDIKLDLIISA